MIFDNINNSKQYENLNPNFKKAFDFLKNNDLSTFENGKVEIEGDNIFVNIQSLKTKQKEQKRWEKHEKYIDIQFLIKGKETIGFGLAKDFNKIVEKYDEAKDIAFLDGSEFNYINLNESDFVIFYPDDIHAPMLSTNEDIEIKKAIVKIKI